MLGAGGITSPSAFAAPAAAAAAMYPVVPILHDPNEKKDFHSPEPLAGE